VAGALVLAGGVLTGLAHHPTRSQRAADVNTFLTEMTTDIQSCAGGVRESLTALHAIESGAEHDVSTATHIVEGLVTWAFPDAQQVQTDVAHVLGASGAARAAANAKLQRDLRTLDAQRAYLNKIMMNAVSATSATGKPPPLPG
jgi:hypothetical protein